MGKNQVFKVVDEIDVANKNVLVRLDLDVPLEKLKVKSQKLKISDDSRLRNALPTIQYLVDRQAKITIIGHLGRSGGKRVEELSLKPVETWFKQQFPDQDLIVAENLRFDPGEEDNSPIFAQNIVRRYSPDVYVFEAFAVYRPHASVVSVSKLVPEVVVGFRFTAELSHLSKLMENPKRPVVFVLGGAKADTKISLIPKLMEVADEILIGGLLPKYLPQTQLPTNTKLTVAELTSDGLDITGESVKMFADKIMQAGTVVWNGPLGAFEGAKFKAQSSKFKAGGQAVENQLKNTSAWGTYLVAKSMNETKAYTVAGGGDTETALSAFGLESGVDWISSGGGAMLYYLANGTLPFLEAISQ